MQKRTIILTVVSILFGGLILQTYGLNENNQALYVEYSASKVAFEQKEQGYKQEIESLKNLLRLNKSSLKEREKQIEKISLANNQLTKEKINLLRLENEIKTLSNQIKDFTSKVTAIDQPDYNDTSKITNIDIEVINNKFKNGALKNEGELLVKIATEHNISPHFFIAVIALESAYGKSKLARTNNNFGGIKANRNKYRMFESKEEGLRYMAKLIQTRYHDKGRLSVAQIQKIYAPSWDGNYNWTAKVKTIMKQIHQDALS